ncbi:MAG: hypothetical protein VZR53_10330 [Prevotella sp.]|nr:hypothetical protein [Prevotella sp.]
MADYVDFNPNHLSEKELDDWKRKLNRQAFEEAWKKAEVLNWTLEMKELFKKESVVLYRKELVRMLYKFQEYEKVDDETTVITTNAKNIITNATWRTHWDDHDKYAKYGYRILDIEQVEDKRLWRLTMQIPFEKIEGWFNHDLEKRLKEIDKVCR